MLAPFIGRAGAAGIAGFVLIAAFLVNGYSSFVPVLGAIANLSWFSWTAGHQPLAGMTDWPSLIPVALVAIVLLALGTEAFSAAIWARPAPSRHRACRGRSSASVVRSAGRSGSDCRRPSRGASAWASSGSSSRPRSGSLADAFKDLSPDTMAIFSNVFPNVDITSAGGFLQIVFIELGFIIVGFAAATLVAGWASDETSGRLEMLIATPLGRAPWAIRSGIGVYLAIAVMTVVLGMAVGLGAALAGSDALTPAAGAIVLGLYTAALAGIGFAVGGLIRTSIAAEVVAVIVVLTFLIDLLGPALRLPDGIHQLALSAHLGQPMVGIWDGAGIVACVVIAVGGLALGGWGMRRRDLARVTRLHRMDATLDPVSRGTRSRGTLLLADISGYTGFLQGVAEAHYELIVEAETPPLPTDLWRASWTGSSRRSCRPFVCQVRGRRGLRGRRRGRRVPAGRTC